MSSEKITIKIKNINGEENPCQIDLKDPFKDCLKSFFIENHAIKIYLSTSGMEIEPTKLVEDVTINFLIHSTFLNKMKLLL